MSEKKGADIKFAMALTTLLSAVPPQPIPVQTVDQPYATPVFLCGSEKIMLSSALFSVKAVGTEIFCNRRYRDSNPTKQLDQYYCEVLLTPDPPQEEFEKIHFKIVIELFPHISEDVSEICDHLTWLVPTNLYI